MGCNARYYSGGKWVTPPLWAYTILRTISKHGLIIGSWENYLWQENKYVIIISILLHQYVNKVYYWARYFVQLLHPHSRNKNFSLKEAVYRFTFWSKLLMQLKANTQRSIVFRSAKGKYYSSPLGSQYSRTATEKHPYIFILFFFSALLRYYWHICKYKVHNIIWYIYILQKWLLQ